jgi:hypothetical protein
MTGLHVYTSIGETKLTGNLKSYYIYQVIFTENGMDMNVEVKLWQEEKLLASADTFVNKWYLRVGSWSSHLSSAYELIGSFREPSEQSFYDIVQYIGNEIWDVIHADPAVFAIWECFEQAVNEEETESWVILNGPGLSAAVPIECLYVSKKMDFLQKHSIPVIRTNENIKAVTRVPALDSSWPEKLIVLLGKDSDMERFGRTLGYEQEVRMWLKLMQPDREWTDDEIKLLLLRGSPVHSNPSMGRHIQLEIVYRGDLNRLAEVIDEIKEPFVFLYVGHGEYGEKNKDGELKWQDNEALLEMNSFEQLTHLLRKSDVHGIFLYCCEGFRNVVFAPTYGSEHHYFEQLHGLHLLSGYRSKILDYTGQAASSKLLTSMLKGETIGEYLRFSRAKELSKPNSLKPDNLRDFLSKVFFIR